MFRYRDHRGSLDASMATCREFTSLEELAADVGFKSERLIIEWYAYDPRINWNCWIVRVEGFGVLGFTDKEVRGIQTREYRGIHDN